MKILKIVGIVIISILILLLIISFFLPSKVQVERSIEIDAPQETIFAQVNSLKNWEHWSPWELNDPNMESTFSGPDRGVGAIHQWESEQSGNGKQEITESNHPDLIRTKLDFGEQGSAESYWHFEKQNGKTRVTWGMTSDMGQNPVGKYIGLMMDSMIGNDYEEGLNNLKDHTEVCN